MEDFGHKQYKYRLVYQPKKYKIKNMEDFDHKQKKYRQIQKNLQI